MIDHTLPATGLVVGVDGNPDTVRAVTWAAREAARRHLPLDLVQVLPPSERDLVPRAPTGRALRLLDHARRTAATVAPSVDVRLSTVDGVVGPALAHLARPAELLVIGARAVTGALDVTVGRTATHLMREAPCPVVIIGEHDAAEVEVGGNVVVGVDGSREALGAIAFAADIADRWRGRLIAVACVAPMGADGDDSSQQRFLAEAVAGISSRHPDVELQESVVRGIPSQELLRVARGARLLVLGARGRGTVAGALLGSTSQAAVRTAACPVAILPPQSAPRWADLDRAHTGASS
jgi:nucleotide-binding universal stress UspA family protein